MLLWVATHVAAPVHAASRISGILPAGSTAGVSWFVVSFELGPWDDYLIHELTPNLERLTIHPIPRVKWLTLDDTLIIPDFADALMQTSHFPLMLSIDSRQSGLNVQSDSPRFAPDGLRFEQSLLMPGLTSRLNDSSTVTISAVLASQRYGTSGLNLIESDKPSNPDNSLLRQSYSSPEVVHGAGLRLALSSDLMERFTIDAAYQSRIDMAELTTLRGVHGTLAELDIPSRVQVGLQFHPSERTSLRFGIEQIFYSEVGAFPSRALPARFTALLGDSTSPRFAWDDLAVFSLGWQWQHANDLVVFVDYRTRSQPKPTSDVLAATLGPELAQNAFLAGMTKSLSKHANMRLSAAYAPPEFAFGGNVLGVVSDRLDQAVEVQALLRFDF